MLITTRTFRLFGGACALVLFSLAFVPSSNASLIVEFTGLDVSFDGTDIADGSVGLDPLTTVTVEADGLPVTGSPFIGGAGLDLFIPSVDPIPLGGGIVGTAPGGTLDLDLGGAGTLSLDLGPATVSFLDFGLLQFAFAASASTVAGQALPDGVEFLDPVSVSFSTSVDSFTTDGSFITSFVGSGTGELSGDLVPEPMTAVAILLSFGGFALTRRWRIA